MCACPGCRRGMVVCASPPLLTCGYSIIWPRCCICCNFGPYSAAAAGGAAAFAHVAAARGAHLCAAGEAERRVRGATLMLLDQLHGGMRGRRWRGMRQPFGILMLERCGLGPFLQVRLGQLSR